MRLKTEQTELRTKLQLTQEVKIFFKFKFTKIFQVKVLAGLTMGI